MLCAMARAVAFGLPWLAVMAISVTVAYAMNMALTSGTSTTARAVDPVSTAFARPVGSVECINGARMVYLGANSSIRDPSESCRSDSTAAD
jgi:hypothetical protein